jgi:N6-adenosine-specific RNA methylase IME4
VNDLAGDTSVLFLWATNPLLEDALMVMSAWGFQYKTNIAWVKDRGRGKGWYLKSKHEILLIGVRDKTEHPAIRPDSAQLYDRPPKHSKKPDGFYDMIDAMYPNGKRIELFARNPHEGYEAWGNEA